MYFSGGKMLANDAFPSNTQSRVSKSYFRPKSSGKANRRFQQGRLASQNYRFSGRWAESFRHISTSKTRILDRIRVSGFQVDWIVTAFPVVSKTTMVFAT
jgi:hypothetical protein